MYRNRILSVLVIFVITILFAGTTFADQKEDTLALIKKGNEYIKTNGVEKAVAAFQTEEFKKGDLYLFAYNYEGVCIAQGARPDLVGKDLSKLKTPEGEYHIINLINIAKKGGGWHEYKWMHPYEKKLREKVSYIQPIDGMDAFISCGYWK